MKAASLLGFIIGFLTMIPIYAFCAWYFPWWSLPLVTSGMTYLCLIPYFKNRLSLRHCVAASAVALSLVLFEQNKLGDGAPSRAFARLMSLERLGVSIDSWKATLLTVGLSVFVFTFVNALVWSGISNLRASTSKD